MSHPWEWRFYTPCPATQGEHGCEREAGHDPAEHWWTVWEYDVEAQEAYPSYPVTWSEAVNR